jgi:hypothetical protein
LAVGKSQRIAVATGNFLTIIGAMSVIFRLCLLGLFLSLSACVNRDEARNEVGLQGQVDETAAHIPAATPGPGYERIQKRPDATPTPPSTNPMDKPLDPTGLPSGN